MHEISPEQPMIPPAQRRIVNYDDPSFMRFCEQYAHLEGEYADLLDPNRELRPPSEVHVVDRELNQLVINNPDYYADFMQARRDADELAREQYELDKVDIG